MGPLLCLLLLVVGVVADYGLIFHDEAQVTWEEAEALCTTDGGHLPSVHDETENSYLFRGPATVYANASYVTHTGWIGAHYMVDGKGWEWSDGTTFDWENWARDLPEVDETALDCAWLERDEDDDDAHWKNGGESCEQQLEFVCQYDMLGALDIAIAQWTHMEIECYKYTGPELIDGTHQKVSVSGDVVLVTDAAGVEVIPDDDIYPRAVTVEDFFSLLESLTRSGLVSMTTRAAFDPVSGAPTWISVVDSRNDVNVFYPGDHNVYTLSEFEVILEDECTASEDLLDLLNEYEDLEPEPSLAAELAIVFGLIGVLAAIGGWFCYIKNICPCQHQGREIEFDGATRAPKFEELE